MIRASKSFVSRGVEFRPCQYQQNLDAGLRWYAVCVHPATHIEWSEDAARKFRTKTDCERHALEAAMHMATIAGDLNRHENLV